MIELKDKYKVRTDHARKRIAEVCNFQNSEPAVVIVDAPNWIFGELPNSYPGDYCGGNYEVMLQHQIKKIKQHDINDYDDCYEPFLMPWYGTCVLASAFGAEYTIHPFMDPAVNVSQVEDISYVYELKQPDFMRDGLCPRVLDTITYFKENCDLPIMMTDCQGPLTNALSLVGYENFMYWMYDEPEALHLLMQKITDALIAWMKLQKDTIGIAYTEPGYQMAVRTGDGKGGAVFSDDDAIILDPDFYQEFVKPYNQQVLMAFGGGCIHCCGDVTHQIENIKNTKGLTLYHNMTLDNLENAAKLQDGLREKNIAYVVGDFTLADNRLDNYYGELFRRLTPEGLIIASYIAPAVALNKGKYTEANCDAVKVGKRVFEIIQKNIHIQIEPKRQDRYKIDHNK